MIRFRFWRSVEDAASAEALASPLPGYYDGPADAYRHIVGTAELRRRFGFGTAYALATTNEMLGTHASGHPPELRRLSSCTVHPQAMSGHAILASVSGDPMVPGVLHAGRGRACGPPLVRHAAGVPSARRSRAGGGRRWRLKAFSRHRKRTPVSLALVPMDAREYPASSRQNWWATEQRFEPGSTGATVIGPSSPRPRQPRHFAGCMMAAVIAAVADAW